MLDILVFMSVLMLVNNLVIFALSSTNDSRREIPKSPPSLIPRAYCLESRVPVFSALPLTGGKPGGQASGEQLISLGMCINTRKVTQ